EVVEGYSNFLLVAIEAAAIRCGVDPVLAMTLVGRASLVALAALVAVLSHERIFPGRPVVAILVGAAAALSPLLVCWAHSGLEGTLYALLLMAGVTAAVSRATAGAAVLSAAALVLAGMTRLEAVVVFPVALLVVHLRTRQPRLVGLHAGVLAVGFGAYFGTRALHFGYLLPNTFYAKLDYGNTLLAARGALY